ncbi:MAG TPA: carcinine hydrolase/isopenicillin-N N-acyltransferase family protein [Gemmataceae bacterium]|nr:carcinine hydrolase/isopenicillin-N N-acyltransferase family protein [Gemmataceae bacterium]
MGCDMVVALARATADGQTLFGHNSNRPRGEAQAVVRTAGKDHTPGEKVRAPALELPEARHTHAVLANRPAGLWGYPHGVNEHGVCAGVTTVRTRLSAAGPGLSGTDLVRLALERAASACQAVDVLTDLITRHGQGSTGEAGRRHDEGGAGDCAFLVADGREAFALEATGNHWVLQVIGAVRAASDVCHLRQDWDRISRGLADLAIQRGWWPANGSKLDFAGALAREGGDSPASLRRWGRATLLLEQQSGQIDAAFLRRLLSDHGESAAAAPGTTLCQHGGPATAASLLAQVGADEGTVPVAWCAFGPPCSSLYFPLYLEGDLPAAFEDDGTGAGCRVWRRSSALLAEAERDPALMAGLGEDLAALQERFELEARDFAAEAQALKRRGTAHELHRLAGAFMQHNLESWENVCESFHLSEVGAGPGHAGGELYISGVVD